MHKDLDELEIELYDALPPVPPEEIVSGVNPWSRAMGMILWGMGLQTVTINGLLLNYILPAVGMVLCLLGFRALRRENRAFTVCWWISLLKAASLVFMSGLQATVYHGAFRESSPGFALMAIGFLLSILRYFCLWLALRAIQRKAGLAPHAGGLWGLILWSFLILILSSIQIQGGWLSLIVLGGLYFLCIRSLVKVSRELGSAGYALEPCFNRLPDGWLALLAAVLLFCSIGCGYLFGGSYRMSWAPRETDDTPQVAQVKAELLELGFPEDVLEDMLSSDILACAGAQRIEIQVHNSRPNNLSDAPETLRFTAVAVLLPEERTQWRIIHHFRWLENPGFYGTEAIKLFSQVTSSWAISQPVQGQLLYDSGDRTYTAPYHSLGQVSYTSSSVLFGNSQEHDWFATFSLPEDGENCRGYLSYTMSMKKPLSIIDAEIFYTHQHSILQYPAKTAMEHQMQNALRKSEAFRTFIDQFLFNPWDEDSK